ncbi:MAG: SagB/ThcOx family dehydrogenase [Blautia sp.]|nr:SagB/ThcOx family dehydrogenase [Blautia sp.]MDY3997704.1 SagB/ThcOx family dehydrogenase [Blautia sp.]
MNDKTKYEIMKHREMMKGYSPADAGQELTDQEQKLPFPEPVKAGKGSRVIDLPLDFEDIVQDKNLFELLQERESCRAYKDEELSLKELSFLLWATQGIRRFAGKMKQVTFRNVPSAGSRHAMETYLFIHRVEGIPAGIYHYLPSGHSLELWEDKPDYIEELTEALAGQKFAGTAPVTFVWSVIPYRTEWRYGMKAHRYMLMDAGHACENLYLACEAIGCGTCAVGAYNQDLLDDLLGFPGGPSGEMDDEFALYAAPVGKKENR